ncbi:MAG: hypothetical protein HY473_00905 [Candidatus Sungbacteria bacterium]|uniref:Uncharacterized protein n=1 Tax=Candidatus Sungiibacteriota bacterium TaxID=2750080 RepID=A0A932YWE5_9BACT|nr:hypothetical protein [Candidatus Sungbacteria bacterium]
MLTTHPKEDSTLIQLKFIDPLKDPDGLTGLACTFSESHRDEQVMRFIGESLNRRNLISAVSELARHLSAKERDGRVEGTEALGEFKRCLQQHDNFEVRRLSTVNQQNGLREFVRTFRYQFVREPVPGPLPLPASAPSWALSGRQDPGGGSEY